MTMREQMTHKTVPVEPTEEMIAAANEVKNSPSEDCLYSFADIYKAMLAAAPQPQDSEPVSSMDYGQFIDEVTNPPQQAEIKRLTAEIERLNKENKNWQKVTIHQANEIERLEAALAARPARGAGYSGE
jgi:hypothetical protein